MAQAPKAVVYGLTARVRKPLGHFSLLALLWRRSDRLQGQGAHLA
jgi:hypothetical protein